jgi:hypothetical protein
MCYFRHVIPFKLPVTYASQYITFAHRMESALWETSSNSLTTLIYSCRRVHKNNLNPRSLLRLQMSMCSRQLVVVANRGVRLQYIGEQARNRSRTPASTVGHPLRTLELVLNACRGPPQLHITEWSPQRSGLSEGRLCC